MEQKKTEERLKKTEAELTLANSELLFQNEEKEKRAAELIIANRELVFQNEEKEKRAAELIVANRELAFQNNEKGKRAAELVVANEELLFQNAEKEKRKIANQELQAISHAEKLTAQYSRSLIEASLDPLVTISARGKITDVNEASIKITGTSREELIGSDFSSYFTQPQKARQGYEQVFKNGFVADYPLTIRHTSGTLTDVLYNASLYKDNQGNVLGVFAAARDISAQKAAQAALNKSLLDISVYKLALDKSFIVDITDGDGVILHVNDNFCRVSKYSREELIGKEHRIINTGYNSRAFMKDIWDTITSDDIWTGEIKNRAKDGSTYWVDATIVPFFSESGRHKQYLAIKTDITAKKILSQYNRSLLEASLDPLVTISAEGKITDVNEASISVTGVSREGLTGTDFSDYFTESEMAKKGYEEVFRNGFVADYPLTVKHTNGKLTDVLYNASVYRDDSGNVLGIFAAARDITNQKQSSHYARSLIEASLDPLITINKEGKIMDVNEAMVKATDQPREKLKGTLFNTYFVESVQANAVYNEVFEKGFVMNSPLTIIDGVLTDVIVSGSVYKDMLGNTMGAVLVARDITYLKKIEKELTDAKIFAESTVVVAEEAKLKAEDATLTAENAVKAKQQFLSNMSHEIRTPMNAIIGFTKVMLKTELTAKQKEYLTAIKLSGDSLIVLINDILDLAKVDAGKMVFEQVPFRLSLSISSLLHLFEPKIQEKNLQLIKEYDNAIPDVVAGDPVRLHQIIINLLSNAVKFTGTGSITVKIALLSEDAQNVVVAFSIADTGIGITGSKLETIFENFQQASSCTSRLYGGTGLGLAIVKQLVEAQGGAISVESTEDAGSVFKFTLSFQKTNAVIANEIELSGVDDEAGNIKVLVVEDIALNQLLMKTLLDDFGFERDVAANGKIAIEKLETNTYDIILMDLQMPEMNGFEATDYIRNTLHSNVPIIALTADVTTVDLAKCKAVGMNDYLAKPIDERLLYSKIISLVKKQVKPETGPLHAAAAGATVNLRCIDLKYLNNRTKSDPGLMMEMISLYMEQMPPLVSQMKKGFQDGDWNGLYLAVHKMIPSFAIMGISADFEMMAKKIQDYASTRQQADGIPELVAHLERVCTQACQELQIEFNAIKNANT